jgi:hypothetical protein
LATPLPTNPDTITIASATSGIAPSYLAAAIAIVQATTAASRERTAVVEAVLPQEQATTIATVATTSRAATALANLIAALAALQARVTTAEVEAQQARVVATALELQLTDILRVAAPPPRPTTAPAPAPVAEAGQVAPTAGTFETSSVGYLDAQAVGIQDIQTLVPVVLGVTSTQYPRWRILVLLMLQRYALDDHISSNAPTLDDPH